MPSLPIVAMMAFGMASGIPADSDPPLIGSITLPELLASLDGNCWVVDENGEMIEGEALLELQGEVEIECFAEMPPAEPLHAGVI